MEFFNNFVNTLEFQTFLKIILGALLTGVIGLERSSLNKPAGFGTHAILGVSGVLVVVCSQYLTLNYDIDMSRLPAQLLSGIGFIGAGTIMQKGMNVKGVTTAAGLLSVTCIGLTVGSGFYMGGIIATLVVYLILSYAHNISDKFERYVRVNLEVLIEKDVNKTITLIDEYLNKKKIELRQIKREEKSNEQELLELVLDYDARYLNKTKIIEGIISISNVKEVTEQ